jgi:mRNA interferase MazF
MEISQYQTVLMNPDDATAGESKSTIQCLVISPDEMNRNLNTVIIAPVIPGSEGYPTRVKIRFNNKPSQVVLDQVTTVEKHRIIKVLGTLSTSEIKKIKAVLKETFID